MGVVRIGQTEVAYELRRSAAASERRITVTPGHVEVLALTTDDQAEIDALHHQAHDHCEMAHSVRATITVEATVG